MTNSRSWSSTKIYYLDVFFGHKFTNLSGTWHKEDNSVQFCICHACTSSHFPSIHKLNIIISKKKKSFSNNGDADAAVSYLDKYRIG